MRIISKKKLSDFWTVHADSEQPLRALHEEFKRSAFTTPQDIKERYSSASFVGDNRVVLNIGGNKYRLVVFIRYDLQLCYIKFIGTHAEYDKIDVLTIEK
ncbi:type II toxin-antitoxin system HigB family toxin [Aeromonas hydrophila]|uniref:type II toxin-antitoxin system HigB family toxin n=1 Tax=Aeromonas hydrophila TaxID=644 RepID=UPI003D20957B